MIEYLSTFPFSLFFSCAKKGRNSSYLLVNFLGSDRRSDLVARIGGTKGIKESGFGVPVVTEILSSFTYIVSRPYYRRLS